LDLQARLIFKYQKLTENSQSYSKYLPILIGSIFYRNIQIVENVFIRIYLGIRVQNKILTPNLFT